MEQFKPHRRTNFADSNLRRGEIHCRRSNQYQQLTSAEGANFNPRPHESRSSGAAKPLLGWRYVSCTWTARSVHIKIVDLPITKSISSRLMEEAKQRGSASLQRISWPARNKNRSFFAVLRGHVQVKWNYRRRMHVQLRKFVNSCTEFPHATNGAVINWLTFKNCQ